MKQSLNKEFQEDLLIPITQLMISLFILIRLIIFNKLYLLFLLIATPHAQKPQYVERSSLSMIDKLIKYILNHKNNLKLISHISYLDQ